MLPKHRPKPAYSEAHYVWSVFQKHHLKPAYSEAHYMWPVFQKHRPKLTVQKPTTCGQNAFKTSPKTCLFRSPLHIASLPKTLPKTDRSEAHYMWLKCFQNIAQNLPIQKPTMCDQSSKNITQNLPIQKPTMRGQSSKTSPKTCLFRSPLHVASLSKTSPKTDCLEAHYVWPKRFQNVTQNRKFESSLCVARLSKNHHLKMPI